MQLLGAGSLLIVVATHVFETFHFFPSMQWGFPDSIGHYIDFCSATLGLILFPVGYLCGALSARRA